tara:strand:+ start:1044 stop:1268 length:225 start_codon:yes stop_codon:yes gene_type:complete
MKKLLSAYSFTRNLEYFYMVHESYINGQFSQAHEYIRDIPKKEKKIFLHYVIFSMWELDKNSKEWLIKHIIELI